MMTESPSKILSNDGTRTTSGASSDNEKSRCHAGRGTVWLLLALAVVATIVAYWPVLFNFFAGDDFVHLTWLTDAVKRPELIWKNFHSSWLDGTTTRFYRPLISIFMVGDYLVWGVNGLGFHLTNLVCHLASTVFLFFILQSVSKAGSDERRPQLAWPLSAALLFGLYPLHPEAVSWITGRVDAVVTTFVLASFWYYISWRERKDAIWFAATVVTMGLALLSKEMAITLPALFFAWEFLLGNSSGGLPARTLNAFKSTFFFWLFLAGYFVLRRIALGTFVGGYDDSLFFVSNWGLFIGGWLHGLRMMLVPINKELMGSHHPLTKIWEISLVASLTAAGITVLRRRNMFMPFAFLVFWLALSLVPVYKIFAIADDLEGSRLAYLATAPLCALITFGLAGQWQKILKVATSLAVAILLIAAGALLWTNNQAWFLAGQESNSIRRELDGLYKTLADDPEVLLIGLPDNINGAYVCRNALVGMTRTPQMSRTVNNCLMVSGFEPIFPFGHLKNSLAASSDKVKVFRWDTSAKRFHPVEISAGNTGGKPYAVFSGQALKTVLTPENIGSATYSWTTDGSLESRGGAGPKGRPKVHIKPPPGSSCWSTEVVVAKVSITSDGQAAAGNGTALGADLLYSNDLHPETELRRRVHSAVVEGDNTLYFALHGIPEWALGGQCRDLQLLLPTGCRAVLKSVAFVSPDTVMPKVFFENSGYMGSKGFTHLSASRQTQEMQLDGRNVPQAARVELEITRPNLTFETQNSEEPSRVVLKRFQCGTTYGTIILKRSDFPSAGMYEARPRALDSQGKPVGVAGDHIVISVDS